MFAIWTLEGVKLEDIERNMLSNIYKDNYNRDQEELVAQVSWLSQIAKLLFIFLFFFFSFN